MKTRLALLVIVLSLADLPASQGSEVSLFDAPLAGGTIYCDGARRGSAVMVDGPEGSSQLAGVFIVSAAHVFYDLHSGQRYQDCYFDYRGLEHLPGYRATLSTQWLQLGDFDPREDPSQARNGHGDWAVAYLPEPPRAAKRHQPIQLAGPDEWPVSRSQEFYLLAWDPDSQRVVTSGPCEGLPSTPADIGGGLWPGQWLDNCGDGRPGSSGGGLLWKDGEYLSLLAIRTGAHWRLGEPGAAANSQANWDPAWSANTSRGVDGEVLQAMLQLAASAVR
ncbi:hypothetical protein F3N42_06980 [Marinihelvus fidelis]|uniref:Trypsin-like peptidase domain-containing protein n=1 Tax=Marinihelvus fidelis TaxID=2613842 RepID=A0A5N0TAC0_9GAMM|nr:hypothetical protein [Marinihelvus fidelis]KAA9131912.1 hypothetical protein F3N42_06980 [Marinihelvus fidelis]